MHYIFKTSIMLSTILLLGACSGHTLQDWADESFNNKSEESEKTIKAAEKPIETTKQEQPSPSQNPQLNTVSPSGTATSKGGAMQESLDKWAEEEWTPTVEQNESIKMMNEDKDRPFTLQEYVDKATIYHENKPESDEPTHYEEMEKLPVIGK